MTEQAWPVPAEDAHAQGDRIGGAIVPSSYSTSVAPPPPPTIATGAAMKHRNIFAVWIGLPIITLGIYHLVWWYKVNAEMASFDPRKPVNPAATLIAIMFGGILIVPPFLAVYGTGQRIAERQRVAGMGSTCSPALGIVLMFVFGLHTLYYQAELNKIVDRYPVPAGSQVALAA